MSEITTTASCPHAQLTILGFIGGAGFTRVVDADPAVAGQQGQVTLGMCLGCHARLVRVRMRGALADQEWDTGTVVLAPMGGESRG